MGKFLLVFTPDKNYHKPRLEYIGDLINASNQTQDAHFDKVKNLKNAKSLPAILVELNAISKDPANKSYFETITLENKKRTSIAIEIRIRELEEKIKQQGENKKEGPACQIM